MCTQCGVMDKLRSTFLVLYFLNRLIRLGQHEQDAYLFWVYSILSNCCISKSNCSEEIRYAKQISILLPGTRTGTPPGCTTLHNGQRAPSHLSRYTYVPSVGNTNNCGLLGARGCPGLLCSRNICNTLLAIKTLRTSHPT